MRSAVRVGIGTQAASVHIFAKAAKVGQASINIPTSMYVDESQPTFIGLTLGWSAFSNFITSCQCVYGKLEK
jgi:hypothetical protein